MEKQTSITIIVPAFNEEGGIKETVSRLKRIGGENNWDLEIIVVNDGSSDQTGRFAADSSAIVINHPTNSGYGLSLQHGIEASTKNLIAITDADGTYPAEKLPELVKMITVENYDMAVGARSGGEYKKGLWKYPARIAFKLLAEFVAGRRIADINSGLRVMKKEKLLPHYRRTCFGFSFTTSITLIFFLNGYFVGYKPIPYQKRVGKSKVKHFRDTLRTAQIMISVISFYNPLKLFLLLVIVNTTLSLFLMIIGSVLDIKHLATLGSLLLSTTPIIFALAFLSEANRLK